MRYLSSAILLSSALFASAVSYANELWRCPGNVYTNQVTEADKTSGRCKPVQGDVSVVPAPGSSGGGVSSSGGGDGLSSVPGSRPVPVPAQRDTRLAQSKIDQAVRDLNALEVEYNNGEPARMGPEFKNYQLYLDRVDRLKGEIEAKKQEIMTLRGQL